MNIELFMDWRCKRMAVMDYRMDTIRKRRKKRQNLMIRILIPFSLSFLVVGAFTFGQFFMLTYVICCFIIAVGFSVLIYLDDADNKKFTQVLESWHDMTDVRFVPPSIKDTFNS
jgi:hypothetical protein